MKSWALEDLIARLNLIEKSKKHLFCRKYIVNEDKSGHPLNNLPKKKEKRNLYLHLVLYFMIFGIRPRETLQWWRVLSEIHKTKNHGSYPENGA